MWFFKKKRYAHAFTFMYSVKDNGIQNVHHEQRVWYNNSEQVKGTEWDKWTDEFAEERGCKGTWVVINHTAIKL